MNGNTLIIKKIVKLFRVSLKVEDISFSDDTTRLLIQDIVDVSRPVDKNPAVKLFEEQAVTLTKSGALVSIHCENPEDANSMFDWLESVGAK